MPTLTYTATGFRGTAGSALSGRHSLDVTWSELVWAAISVGRAGMRQILQFGVYSVFEIVYRTALMYANLQETASGYLTRSDAYNALDPSEKGAVSYFLGLTVSKLFAERCLQVPWLLHLDVYRAQIGAVLRPGRSKPDLVGQDCNGNWVIVESKGRTNGFDEDALAKAKAQSRRVRTISGSSPTLRLGVQTYFESSQLRLAIDDPEREEDGPLLDLPITAEMIRHEYYQPFRAWLDRGDHVERVAVGNRIYVVRSEPVLDLAVGLAEERYQGASTAVGADAKKPIQRAAPDQFVGKDGILVRLGSGWSSEMMRREPEHRLR
jgi:hypothetical protein